jgi:hypothetical protein
MADVPKINWADFKATCTFLQRIKHPESINDVEFYEGPFKHFSEIIKLKVIDCRRSTVRYCSRWNRTGGAPCNNGADCKFLHQCIICDRKTHGAFDQSSPDNYVCATHSTLYSELEVLENHYGSFAKVFNAHLTEHVHSKKFVKPKFADEKKPPAAWVKPLVPKASSSTPPSASPKPNALEGVRTFTRLLSTTFTAYDTHLTLEGIPKDYSISTWKGGEVVGGTPLFSDDGAFTSETPNELVFRIRW